MVKTWADREAEKIFNNEISRRLGPQVSKVARRKLKVDGAIGRTCQIGSTPKTSR